MTLIINGKTYEAGELIAYVKKLEKENKDLNERICKVAQNLLDSWCQGDDPCPHLKKRDEYLAKAKELLNMFLRLHYRPIVDEHTLFCKVEQFLSEVGK